MSQCCVGPALAGPHISASPSGVAFDSGPNRRPMSATAASRSQSGPDSCSVHGSSTDAGIERRAERFELPVAHPQPDRRLVGPSPARVL